MGAEIGYVGAHARVYRTRGPARNHLCGCGKPATQWAYNHAEPDPDEMVSDRGQRYSGDPARYLPMCNRCHRLFDKKWITHCPQGHSYEGSNLLIDAGKRKCRTCVYARNHKKPLTLEQRKRKSDLQRQRRAELRALSAGSPAQTVLDLERAA